MLIVGGVAALTAIAVYLAWHFLRQWRFAAKRRDARRGVGGERSRAADGASPAREFVPSE
ncbi:MAG TPA: hypothetical protein VLB11_11740 [Methyloceanibacter sp.]|nr:hypothetical protein [Methyloceanibacter sp.]